MEPVLNEESQQREEAHSHRPEVLDYRHSERTILGSKQLTGHYNTWQKYALTTTQNLHLKFSPAAGSCSSSSSSLFA